MNTAPAELHLELDAFPLDGHHAYAVESLSAKEKGGTRYNLVRLNGDGTAAASCDCDARLNNCWHFKRVNWILAQQARSTPPMPFERSTAPILRRGFQLER